MDPVKESARTRLSFVQGSTIVGARPVPTLKTPTGIPARLANLAIVSAEYGVSLEGCATEPDTMQGKWWGLLLSAKLSRIRGEEGLTARKGRTRREAIGTRAPILFEAKARWSLDFVHDQLASGRRVVRELAEMIASPSR